LRVERAYLWLRRREISTLWVRSSGVLTGMRFEREGPRYQGKLAPLREAVEVAALLLASGEFIAVTGLWKLGEVL
jgi:hypothetical protein